MTVRLPDSVQIDRLKAMGVTYRKLDYWARNGWLSVPDPLPGIGYTRDWSKVTFRELAACKVVAAANAAAIRRHVTDVPDHRALVLEVSRVGAIEIDGVLFCIGEDAPDEPITIRSSYGIRR